MKGCPYDNAVAEASSKFLKIKFVNNYYFSDLGQLEIMLADYVNWFNIIRIHSTLDYLSPQEHRLQNLKMFSSLVLTIQITKQNPPVKRTEEPFGTNPKKNKLKM